MPTNSQGIGTTKFFFLPNGQSHQFQHGDYYFVVKNYLSRVILTGGWWKDVTSIALTTGAKAAGGQDAAGKSINQAVRVNQGIRNTTISCAKNIVDLVPSTMQQFNIEAQLVATRRDPVQDFMGLVQSEAFSTAFSFAPGPLAVLKSFAPVVPGLIKVFEGDAPKSEPALNATEDFTLTTRSVQPGFLVALASMGSNTELNQPISAQDLSVTPTDVKLRNKPIVQASYVVLEFEVVRYRGIGGTDAQWVALFEKTMQALEDLESGIGIDDKATILETARKGLYAVSEMQAEDRSFTKTEMAIYRQKLRDKYNSVATETHPMNIVSEVDPSIRIDLTSRAIETLSSAYDDDLHDSLSKLARFGI